MISNMKKRFAKGSIQRMFIFLLFSVSTIGTSNNLALAQSISGVVVDEMNKPLEFANVILLSPKDSAFLQGTVSNEAGSFQLPALENRAYLLKVSSVGYETVCRESKAGNAGKIQLLPFAVMLDEAIVTGKLPTYQLKGDALITHVQNSLLRQAGTANDVLKHIPGIQGKEGELTVFGKGTPLIFINGREVHDLSELDQLSSEEIQKVELITSPGARYGADVKSVIRIKTVKPVGEGFGFDTRTTMGQAENTDFIQQLNVNYRYKKLDIFGNFNYNHNNSIHRSIVEQQVFIDTLWTQKNTMYNNRRNNNYKSDLGFNYLLSEKNAIGIRYSIDASPRDKSWTTTNSDVWADGLFYDKWKGNSYDETQKAPAHRINTYYNGESGKLTIDFNADVVWNETEKNSFANEISQEFQDREVTSFNKVQNRLYAGKLIFSYPLVGGSLSAGFEYTATRRNDMFSNPQQILPSTDSKIKEDKISTFAEYSRMTKVGVLNLGVRYEHVASNYFELGKKVEEQSRTYNNLFPNLSFATRIGKVQAQLSYTSKTQRPGYYELRSNMDYMNRYTYQSGNPYLRPSTVHDLTLAGTYKWIQFMASYKRHKDAIIYSAEQYEENPAITLVTHRNFDKMDVFSAYLVAAPLIGCWQPQLTVGLQKQWMNLEYNGEIIQLNAPMPIARMDNRIKLPKGFVLSVDMDYTGKGDYQNVHLTNTQFVINAGITKSFVNDRLSFNIQGIDLTRGRKDGNLLFNKQMHLYQYNKYDTREVRFTIRYKFNTTKSKYKGTGAAGDEIRRLSYH